MSVMMMMVSTVHQLWSKRKKKLYQPLTTMLITKNTLPKSLKNMKTLQTMIMQFLQTLMTMKELMMTDLVKSNTMKVMLVGDRTLMMLR